MKILNEAMEELKEEDWYQEAVGEDGNLDKTIFSRQFVKETVIETDLQLLIPEAYVSSLTERLLLYRELDNITKDEDLIAFEKNIRDRFGPIPTEAIELISLVRMRWQAMKLGFEKLTLKNGKLLTYFLSKQDSDYFNSPMFKAALAFAQKFPNRCKLKEQNNRLWLTIEDVTSIKKSAEVLSLIEGLILNVV
jgi:transcription-repair coupling factor (superfamily II helicase)